MSSANEIERLSQLTRADAYVQRLAAFIKENPPDDPIILSLALTLMTAETVFQPPITPRKLSSLLRYALDFYEAALEHQDKSIRDAVLRIMREAAISHQDDDDDDDKAPS
jgi:hypothetical protein